MPRRTRSSSLIAAAAVAVALALAGCGGSAHSGSSRPAAPAGPWLQTLSSLQAALHRANIPVHRLGAAGDLGSLPHPERSVAYAASGGTRFSVLVYRDQDTALRAVYSLRSGGRTPIVQQNLIVVFDREATVEGYRIAGVVQDLGAQTT